MAIIVGIDEAGLGPSLGPLVISCVAFRAPDDRIDECLWRTLRESCASKVTKSSRRLVIADSKKLFRRPGPLDMLERSALVMLSLLHEQCTSLRDLLGHLAPDAIEHLDQTPWYRSADLPLPLGGTAARITTQANAVRRDFATNDVQLHSVCSEVLTAAQLNRLLGHTHNKAVVSMGLTLRLIDRVLRSAPNERFRIFVDRLGGRTRYRDPLMTAWPDHELQIVEESPTRSAYRLTRSSRAWNVEFATSGETKHFTVALASIFSKYLRELYMTVFNRYWSAAIPGIRPTAGYYTDAQRWLKDASDELDRRSLDRMQLVRER